MGFRQHLVRRTATLLAVLVAVTGLSFLLTSLLPGDPTTALLGTNATAENVAALRDQLDLDDPMPVRYVKWLGNLVQGDMGRSYASGEEVSTAIRRNLPVTFELLLLSQVVALGGAIPLAVLSARRPDGIVDRLTTSLSFGLISIPYFMLAVLMVFLFAERLGWFPATGYTPFTEDPVANLRGMALPAFSLGLAEMAAYTRLLRTDMIATLQEDYITMAKAKGLSPLYILMRHAFRPSTFSLVTVAGLNVGRLIGGTFIVEYIFAVPGLGQLALNGIFSREYLVVQGTVVVVAVGYVLVNFVVDILYSILDPRTRARAIA